MLNISQMLLCTTGRRILIETNIFFSKPKPKSKKQLQAEQRRREKVGASYNKSNNNKAYLPNEQGSMQASHPVIKSLTKTSKKWPWASKIWELLAHRTSWNSSLFQALQPPNKANPADSKRPIGDPLYKRYRGFELRTIKKQIQLVLRRGGPYCFLPTL